MTKTEKERADEVIAQRVAKGDVFEVKIGNRTLRQGDVITIRGERGTFSFRAARVVNGEVLWLQVVGGAKGHVAWRHFTPDRLGAKKRALTKEVQAA